MRKTVRVSSVKPNDRWRMWANAVGRADAPEGRTTVLTTRDLWLLELLVTVVDRGSMTAAAREVNLSTPAVSEAVAKLERLVGSQLLIRTASGCRPTLAGKELLAAAATMLSSVEAGLGRLNGVSDTVLRVGNMMGAYTHRLAERLDDPDQPRLPGFTLVGAAMPIDDPAPDVLNGTVNVALVLGPTRLDHELDRVPVRKESRVAVLPIDGEPSGAGSVSLEELDQRYWPSIPQHCDQVYLRPWLCADVRPGLPPLQDRPVAEIFDIVDWMLDPRVDSTFATTFELLRMLPGSPGLRAVPIDCPPWELSLVAPKGASLPLVELADVIRRRLAPPATSRTG